MPNNTKNLEIQQDQAQNSTMLSAWIEYGGYREGCRERVMGCVMLEAFLVSRMAASPNWRPECYISSSKLAEPQKTVAKQHGSHQESAQGEEVSGYFVMM